MDKNTRAITNKIITALSNRGGFDGWWDEIDKETRDEIKDEISQIIEKNLDKTEKSV